MKLFTKVKCPACKKTHEFYIIDEQNYTTYMCPDKNIKIQIKSKLKREIKAKVKDDRHY